MPAVQKERTREREGGGDMHYTGAVVGALYQRKLTCARFTIGCTRVVLHVAGEENRELNVCSGIQVLHAYVCCSLIRKSMQYKSRRRRARPVRPGT